MASSCRHADAAALLLLLVLVFLIVSEASSVDLQNGVEALQRRRTSAIFPLNTRELIAAVELRVLVVSWRDVSAERGTKRSKRSAPSLVGSGLSAALSHMALKMLSTAQRASRLCQSPGRLACQP
jgi:hypothetical protein